MTLMISSYKGISKEEAIGLFSLHGSCSSLFSDDGSAIFTYSYPQNAKKAYLELNNKKISKVFFKITPSGFQLDNAEKEVNGEKEVNAENEDKEEPQENSRSMRKRVIKIESQPVRKGESFLNRSFKNK